MKYKVALIFQKDNFIGKEYYHALCRAGCPPDILVSVGTFSKTSHAREVARTSGLWNPKAIPDHLINAHFNKTSDNELLDYLKEAGSDIIIQGGVGILKSNFVNEFSVGIVNVHPGQLPNYRGCNCPEWALYNGDDVWSTAHFIDSGIDTGPIILSRQYQYPSDFSYPQFRANLYRHNANVLLEGLNLIQNSQNPKSLATPQDDSLATYYGPMGYDKLRVMLASRFPI